MKREDIKPLNVEDIYFLNNFPEYKYYKEEYNKKQIVIHHTVSDSNSCKGDIDYWISNKNHISTPFIITKDGKITQCFSAKYWSHHIGLKSSFLYKKGYKDFKTRNEILNKSSIAIELDNWGWLERIEKDKYKNAYNSILNLKDEDVQYYEKGFKNKHYYEKYSYEQICSLSSLIIYLCDKYGIEKKVDDNIWSICDKALNGDSGIYTHVSYREDKSDCHPQSELLEALILINNL